VTRKLRKIHEAHIIDKAVLFRLDNNWRTVHEMKKLLVNISYCAIVASLKRLVISNRAELRRDYSVKYGRLIARAL